MTDRELLEAAAKAAGLPDYVPTLREGEGWICVRPPDEAFPYQCIWCPLTDDGDALRLALACSVTIKITEHTITVGGWQAYRSTLVKQGDETGASFTRRAIVRAAAAIGGAK